MFAIINVTILESIVDNTNIRKKKENEKTNEVLE